MDFFDFAGFETAGADVHFANPTIDAGANALDIRIEAPFGDIVSVRDVVSEHRFLTANIAYFRH
jgi:hypothetical protein